jgi:hypothetical protein
MPNSIMNPTNTLVAISFALIAVLPSAAPRK